VPNFKIPCFLLPALPWTVRDLVLFDSLFPGEKKRYVLTKDLGPFGEEAGPLARLLLSFGGEDWEEAKAPLEGDLVLLPQGEGELSPGYFPFDLDGEKKAKQGVNPYLPLAEWRVILRKNLFFLPKLEEGIHPHRVEHSKSVAVTAYQIALGNGLDPYRAFQAGLFHDAAKDWPLERQDEAMKLLRPELRDVLPDFAAHQIASSYRARTEFGIQDPMVLQAIERHCTGDKAMAPLDMVLYVADKTEPTRPFATRDLRELAIRDVEEGLRAVIRDQVRYFQRNGISFLNDPLTSSFYAAYGPKEGEGKC